MKKNLTLRINKELLDIAKKKGINLSHFLEKQLFKLYENRSLYIQVEKRGDRVIQKVVYLK